MSTLVVIRIIPQQPISPGDFQNHLNPAGLGPLQITAFELSFNDLSPGQLLGTANYIAPIPIPGPSPTAAVYTPAPAPPYVPPNYAGSPASGIIQQYDLQPGIAGFEYPYYELESVATAVIEVPAGINVQNVRLEIQWGSGAGATPVPVNTDFYDIAASAGPAPDLNTWPKPVPWSVTPSKLDPWASLASTIFIHLPAPPSTAKPFSFALPTDGTAPPFDTLMDAVQQMLKTDPGLSVTVPTSAASPAGDLVLQFVAPITGISMGMTATGPNIPANTTITAIDPGTGKVTLSQELSGAGVGSAVIITFSPNVGDLSLAQCRHIAREIIWAQQPPPPAPKDPLEELYSNPPNKGSMLGDGSSAPTPNPLEADRQVFEAQLNAYYALANATADRLTNYVYALSAAVACEQMSISATQVLLQFPADPSSTSSGSQTEPQVVLAGFENVLPPENFGAPAAFFYALGALLPAQMAPLNRFQLVTQDRLDHLIAGLAAATHAGTINDSELFVSLAITVNAAQAARRMAALGVPAGASVPLAPLDTLALSTVIDTPKGDVLTFGSTVNVKTGMSVSGAGIASGTIVASLTATTVTLSVPLLDEVLAGTSVIFAPIYSPGLTAIVKAWLAYPPTVPGVASTDNYQAGDDDTGFWPGAANANPADFLSLVLSAVTSGFMIPAPINAALGDVIIAPPPPTPALMPLSPSVADLAAVTAQQWTAFFAEHPDWLPPGTGNTAARTEAFIARLQKFFEVAAGGPSAAFVAATTTAVFAGATVLQFPRTPKISVGMSVAGIDIPAGTKVAAVASTAVSTSVTLSQPITAPTVPAGTNITFSVKVSGGAAAPPAALKSPSQDWLALCLTAYGPFTLGAGFDVQQLSAAAATIFPDDAAAQDCVVRALVTLDALYQVMKSVPLPPPGTPAFEFSVIEALYARGFTSAAQMTALSSDQFQEALVGTVAYELAGPIYTSAAAIAPSSPPAAPSGSFAPVNPDGSLTNCIPPPCTSPLGPIAYLSELLKLSAASTCDAPFAKPISRATSADTPSGSTLPFVSTSGLFTGMTVSGTNIAANSLITQVDSNSVTLSQPVTADVPSGTLITFTAPALGSQISTRLGPVGDLLTSCANLETPLPLIDIANECLEYMAAQSAPTHGAIYNTSADQLAGHILCQKNPCAEEEKPCNCHEPARIFGALPEYSTPATPVSANASVSPAVYNILKTDFSSCRLPYSQALDVSRTYLRHFRSCRFEEMRTFRKCITEFVLDPATDPPAFQSHLWRYPIRIDIAIEYLGITPEEYALLFAGTAASPCGGPADRKPQQPANPEDPRNPPPDPIPPRGVFEDPLREGPGANAADPRALVALFGLPSTATIVDLTNTLAQLPLFLALTCLSYCEFYELWKSGFVDLRNSRQEEGQFPECEPCCLDQISIRFPLDREKPDERQLARLAIFIRLWRKLKESCCFCYSFSQLRDICDVLHLFNGSDINPDFIRQLAAFQHRATRRTAFGCCRSSHSGSHSDSRLKTPKRTAPR